MKKLLASLPIFNRLVALANNGGVALCNSEGAAVFEIQQDNTLFIPYGEYRHGDKIQAFDRAAAEQMQAFANSMAGKQKGIPIYFGHPDVKGHPDYQANAPARGWGQDIEVRDDGMQVNVKYSEVGATAIANAEYRFYSPYWWLRPVKGKYVPFQLISVGLTNNPLIPVPALANDQTSTTNTEQTMDWLLNLIKSLMPETVATTQGDNLVTWLQAELAKPLEQIDPQVKDAIDWLMRSKERVDNLEAAKAQLTTTAANDATKITDLEGKLTTATTKITDLEGLLTAANDATQAARGLLVDQTLERVVSEGRLPEGEKAGQRDTLMALANDAALTSALQELSNRKPLLKTASTLGDLSEARAHTAAANDALARSVERQKLVSEELTALSNDAAMANAKPSALYDIAWQRAAKKKPELFTNAAA